MDEQMTGTRVPYADDSVTGLPMYRNGEPILAAVPTASGRYVIVAERACSEFVTAVTDSGRDGWDNGHYFPFGTPGHPVAASRRAVAFGRALADLLGRATSYLDDSGREALRADLRGYLGGLFNFDPCTRCADRDRADAFEIYAATFGGLPAAARCYLDPCDCELAHGVQVDSGAGA